MDTPTVSSESPASWTVAIAAMTINLIGWGASYVVVVGLKPIAAELGTARSVPSLAYALFLVGTGVGGIGMGWWADRRSVLRPALLGSAMIGAGCIVASLGGAFELGL